MKPLLSLILGVVAFLMPATAFSQVVLQGAVSAPVSPGSDQLVPFTNIISVANLPGTMNQALICRTKWDVMPWEKEPQGWYWVSGSAGAYTLAFANPGHYMRPVILNNIYTQQDETIERTITPRFDYALFDESSKDGSPATEYYQTFIARNGEGTSVTQIGFKPIWEPKGGPEDSDKDFLVSVHRKGSGTPDTWKQVGPTGTVLFAGLNNIPVNGIGARNFPYSVGWNSGEVPLSPGETYAVRIRGRSPSTTFQVYWGSDGDKKTECYRIGTDGKGAVAQDIWMAVSTDGDGLLIPYNKRVCKEPFGQKSHFAPKWTQTYVAQGRGLASVMLYASCTTEQIPIGRQRVMVTVREGGPDGKVVGTPKIGKGHGDWTGDASWGIFAVAFAPGEVPLEPGRTYAIEFETFENYNTLHGFINIKNVPSGDTGGFSPCPKRSPDTYEQGKAYMNGVEQKGMDLDIQVVEYEYGVDNWAAAVEPDNLLVNGDMQNGSLNLDNPAQGRVEGWKTYAIDSGTTHFYLKEEEHPDNRMLQVIGGSYNNKTVDGGWVQSVSGLSRIETYRTSGQVRSSYAVDNKHQCYIGIDPTGQDSDAKAATIDWQVLPALNGVFVDYVSDPVRPDSDSVSVWLRARTTSTDGSPITVKLDPFLYKTDFDNMALRQVRTSPPEGR